MKQFLKKHWPAVLSAIVWLCGIVIGILIRTDVGLDDSDGLGLAILIFGLLFPLCALVACLWYGLRLKSHAKWLLVPLFAALEVLALTDGSLADATVSMALLAAVPAAIGLIIGALIARKKKHG